MTRKCWSRNYWTARGVVPRWQLFSIYAALLVAVIIGFRVVSGQSDDVRRQAVASQQQAQRLQREAVERRDQNCILFERNWVTDIRSLGSTYDYVASLTTKQTRDPLSVAVIRTVPRQENVVQANRPPAYCKGDVGLKDSQIPKMPKRPPRVQALLHR